MARSVDQIIGELNSVYNPQIEQVNKQLAELPAYYQAQTEGLNVAKDNAFRDITGAASARGIVYSGMPIQEQTRYTGEKYLPALAQLQQQKNEKTYGFQSQLTDIYGKRLSQAQALQQQELDREEQARQFELKRQDEERRYQQQLAAQRASASRSGGGGGGRGGSARAKVPTLADAVATVNGMRGEGRYGDSQYGAIAEGLRQAGEDISRGSLFDRALRSAFGFG